MGSDGALWFTVYLGNKIGRITTAGAFTEFTVPTANSRPNGITAGPDGALWFTELQGNKIGRITTAGVITEFTVPTANSSPFGITAGPDGALWFAEAGASKVGRLVLPETLTVAPTTNIAASGVQGGPFSPSSFSYQLSATSGSVNYSIAGVPKWLTASSTSGTATTSAKTVTFAVNSTAKTLAPNSYINNIAFNNATNKQGDTTRTATLTVRPKEFTITVGASPVADGAVSGGGTFAQGCSCAVTATPKPGFKFVDWTEQGKEISTAEKYTFKLEANVVLLAHFE